MLISVGGAAGAVARYLVDGAVSSAVRGAFPWGTLIVNLSGSFALGLLFGLAIERAVLPSDIRAPLMIGFLGAYTTFSTLMLESLRLWEDGSLPLALANLVASSALGMTAVIVGLVLARAL